MRFVTNLIFCTIAVVLLDAGKPSASEQMTLVADEWPPFSGGGLPERGLSMDVTRTVLARAGYDVETAILPWARIVNGAQSGDYDIVTSLFRDAKMQESLYYSDPFHATEVRFVQKKDGDIEFNGIDSIRPYSIAVGTSFLYSPEFDEADFLNKFEVTTTLQGIQMVAAGHVDLTLDSTEVLRHSILRGDPGLMDKIEFLEPALVTQDIHMAVSLPGPTTPRSCRGSIWRLAR